MWPTPRLYSQESLDEALAYLKSVDANLGGTEILAPLQKLLKRLKKEEGEAELVLLTDGRVSNEAEVISLCEKHKAHARVRSFGIGSGVSETLVRELARVTLGSVEMIHTGERIEPKVLRASRHLRTPSLRLTSLSLAGHQLDLADPSPLIYPGELTTLYGKLSAPLDEPTQEIQVVLEGEDPLSLPLTSSEGGSPIMSVLWARGAIRVLERNEARYSYHEGHDAWRASLVALATRYSMMSSQTSFVAVEERGEGEREEAEAPLRKIPLMMLSDHANRSRWGISTAYGAPGAIFASFFGGGGNIGSFAQPRMMSARTSYRSLPSGSPSDALSKRRKHKQSSRFTLDSLLELLALQQASGAFVWGEALERALGKKASELTQEERLDERLITSITLRLFKEKFKAHHDLWRSSAEKANAFMGEPQAGDHERLERAQELLS
jgi:Ca-activated chloride channel family protein